MKEKLSNIWNKTKKFAEDHSEGLVTAAYMVYMMAILGGSLRSLHLANEKTRLEIATLNENTSIPC